MNEINTKLSQITNDMEHLEICLQRLKISE
jgi:hypothetical protein